jgi:hypothetical protein
VAPIPHPATGSCPIKPPFNSSPTHIHLYQLRDSGSIDLRWLLSNIAEVQPLKPRPSFLCKPADGTTQDWLICLDDMESHTMADRDDEGIVYVFMSDDQEIVVSILYVISSTLSIMGSSTIIFKVLRDRTHATSYDRLMLGLSCTDIVSSLGWMLTPFLLPKQTSPRVWAIGTDATCSFLGFVTQLGFSSILYNGFLSYYFLATIRFGVNRRTFALRWEPWIHIFVAFFCLTTSLVGIGVGFFSELSVGMGCWVNNYPEDCIFDDCTSIIIGWIYGPLPVLFSMISLIINNCIIYCHVRKVFRAAEVVVGDEMNSRIVRQNIHKQEVATQGFLYVAAFFFCIWPMGAARGIEAFNKVVVDERTFYWVLVFQAAALPLQGLFNMLIYNRPNLKRVRAAYPASSWMAAMRMACLDRHIPKLADLSKQEANEVRAAPSSDPRRNSNDGCTGFSNLQSIKEEGGDWDDDDEYSSNDFYRPSDPTGLIHANRPSLTTGGMMTTGKAVSPLGEVTAELSSGDTGVNGGSHQDPTTVGTPSAWLHTSRSLLESTLEKDAPPVEHVLVGGRTKMISSMDVWSTSSL